MAEKEIAVKSKGKSLPDQDIQAAIIEIVKRTDIEPERLEKFLDLQVKMEERQAKKAFFFALAGFQGDVPIIPKTKKVNFTAKSGNTTKYNYSPIDEIVHIIKPHLKAWGLSFAFNILKTDSPDQVELVTTIYHKSGHSKDTSYFFKPLHDDQRMNESQRAKSAVTFAKRASLENALGLVTAEEDDDARRAVDTNASSSQVQEIRNLIKKTNSDENKLLGFLRVESLDDLTDFDARKAIHALKQKAAKNV